MTNRAMWGGFAIILGTGCGGGALDLDDEAGLFAAERTDKKFILYTYPDSPTVLIDVRSELDGGTEGQYSGTRSGDASSGYDFELDCLNVGSSPVCDEWGNSLDEHCEGLDDGTLQCDNFFFRPVTSDEISQE